MQLRVYLNSCPLLGPLSEDSTLNNSPSQEKEYKAIKKKLSLHGIDPHMIIPREVSQTEADK